MLLRSLSLITIIKKIPMLFVAGCRKDETVNKISRKKIKQTGDYESKVQVKLLNRLIKQLKDKNKYVRGSAANELGKIGDSLAVEPLISCLKGNGWEVRWYAAKALGNIGDSRAVEPLIASLKDNHVLCRYAAEALGRIGDSRAVEPLISCLKDNDSDVRSSAAEALGRIGKPAVEPLISCLKDDNQDVRSLAVIALDIMCYKPSSFNEKMAYCFAIDRWEKLVKIGQPAVEPLINWLKDEITCYFARKVLIDIGEPAVEPLISCLKGIDREVRLHAAKALGKIGDSRAVEALLACLKDEDFVLRRYTAKALGRIGDSRAVEPLLACLKDKNGDVRDSATIALGLIGDNRAVEPLISCLKDYDFRWHVEALGNIGDSRAVEPLIAYLNTVIMRIINIDAFVQAFDKIGDALSKIGKPAVEPLIDFLNHWDPNARICAARALIKIGKPAVGLLIACLKYNRVEERWLAIEALGEIGDSRAVEPLIACLKDKYGGVNPNAAQALGEIYNNQAVEPLIACLWDNNLSNVHEYAAKALGSIGDSRSVAALVACIKDPNSGRREYAVDALIKIGKPAVESLIACLKDAYGSMSKYAEDALIKIGEPARESWFACTLYKSVLLSVVDALGEIGDKRAVPHLVSILPDWHFNEKVYSALNRLGYLPNTEAEQVYSWICAKDKKNLLFNLEQTKRILINDIRSGEMRKVKNAVYTFVNLGREEIIYELVKIMNIEGNKEMAEFYLNCHNKRLMKAAIKWAKKHATHLSMNKEDYNVYWH